MKRYTGLSQSAVCFIPRKAISCLMLSMALLTVFFFIFIEVKKIIWLRSTERTLFEFEKSFHSSGISDTSNRTTVILKSTHEDSNSTLIQITEKWHKTNDKTIEDILSSDPLCSASLFLLILVVSAPENFEHRDAIRKAWPSTDLNNRLVYRAKTQVFFLVGRSSSRFVNVLLKHEREISGDILLGEYMDTYRNLTLKVIHGLNWVATHCQPSYVLKTDDDCFVNLPLLLHFLLKSNQIQDNLYAGRVRWSAPVVRDPNSRWFVSNKDFKGSRFAPYVSGAGYVLSLDVLLAFKEFSSFVDVFPNEDAYVGAVLGYAGVRPTYSERFVTHSGTWQTCNFLYLFVIHRVSPVRQSEYREMAKKAFEECSNKDAFFFIICTHQQTVTWRLVISISTTSSCRWGLGGLGTAGRCRGRSRSRNNPRLFSSFVKMKGSPVSNRQMKLHLCWRL
ncbi:hypothetical protein JTE90_020235 [Oedothorax gibbosus]|uniref:Hexosyltransferase n=1 Tax=Oedothorax gibbosus TaxID=931172 RepID=A0AAV6V1G7_9ARAC|nr:hypothetical protein JTE90_020235 [Oedothorax gibbosus]